MKRNAIWELPDAKKMEREFDRKIVTEAYISEINKILKGI